MPQKTREMDITKWLMIIIPVFALFFGIATFLPVEITGFAVSSTHDTSCKLDDETTEMFDTIQECRTAPEEFCCSGGFCVRDKQANMLYAVCVGP